MTSADQGKQVFTNPFHSGGHFWFGSAGTLIRANLR